MGNSSVLVAGEENKERQLRAAGALLLLKVIAMNE